MLIDGFNFLAETHSNVGKTFWILVDWRLMICDLSPKRHVLVHVIKTLMGLQLTIVFIVIIINIV